MLRFAYARSLRQAPRRFYSARPDAEPAEFTAEKPTSNTTKLVVAGLTVLVAGVYAVAAGTPGEAAKTAVATDPEGKREFMPPHGGREARSGR
ncbi:hypothetical protein E4U53_007796 [Claviceps sorghi]|nr:hypothetical protein E4U53_007796 [Claviceps sorghi]